MKTLSAILACVTFIGGFVLIQQTRHATAAPASGPSAQEVSATTTKMVAEHRSKQEITRSVFDNHGCTMCHKITPGRTGITDVGLQLTHMHLGCVDQAIPQCCRK